MIEPKTETPARESATPGSKPGVRCDLRLNTDFAQRVYKRVWDRLKGDLYVATVRTNSNGMYDEANAIETFISEEFSKARRDLDAELERTDVLIDSVKLTQTPDYDYPLLTKAEYSTPRAKEYLDLVVKMDQLCARYDMLWLGGVIEGRARGDRSQLWQRRLIKIANRMRELGNQTRVAITKHQEKRPNGSGASASESELAAGEAEAADAPAVDAAGSPSVESHQDGDAASGVTNPPGHALSDNVELEGEALAVTAEVGGESAVEGHDLQGAKNPRRRRAASAL